MTRREREAKQEEMIRLLWDSGRAWTYTELALHFRVDRRTLYRWRRAPPVRAELERRYREWWRGLRQVAAQRDAEQAQKRP